MPNTSPEKVRQLKSLIELKDWQLGPSHSQDEEPEIWIPAVVPGAVQLDWAKHHKWPSYLQSNALTKYQGLESYYWHYRFNLDLSDISPEDRLVFRCKGIDYAYTIYWADDIIYEGEGMQQHLAIPLTWQKHGTLRIVIKPAPKCGPDWGTHHEAAESIKPAVSYGWDFHPRLIPLGIWDKAWLDVYPQSIPDITVNVSTVLDESLEKGHIQWVFDSESIIEEAVVDIEVKDPEGQVVLQISEAIQIFDNACQLSSSLIHPQLWWPHHLGNPDRYTYRIKISVPRIGVILNQNGHLAFRRVKLTHNSNAWDEPSKFPVTRSVAPMQFEINNKPTFIQGTNWAPVDVFPCNHTRETYQKLLNYVKEANLSMVRCWGGGPVNKRSFFELCDQMGILVWQDFSLACNNYPDKPELLAVVDAETRAVIKRLRHHPCLALWCGGNELFNSWSGMGDQSLILRKLNANCLELDPHTPFLTTAPVFGLAHGPYTFKDHQQREVYQSFQESKNTGYTEFGIGGPSSLETIHKLIPKSRRWPIKDSAEWRGHFGFGTWEVIPDAWLTPSIIEHYFGEQVALEDLLDHGQRLQYEGLRFVYEEARRQQPHCSIAMNWCFNEPWPVVANCSVIEYSGMPKAGYEAIQHACRPFCPSLRFDKFVFHPGETAIFEAWLLNNTDEELAEADLVLQVSCGNWQQSFQLKARCTSNSNNLKAEAISVRLPKGADQQQDLKLIISWPGNQQHKVESSTYTLLLKPKEQPTC